MRSMIIFALVVAALVSASEARHLKREAIAADAEHNSKEKEEIKEKPSSNEHKELELEKHELSKESEEIADSDFIAIIGIFIDPKTKRPRVLSKEMSTAAAAAAVF